MVPPLKNMTKIELVEAIQMDEPIVPIERRSKRTPIGQREV
jgi:hypothetical protein